VIATLKNYVQEAFKLGIVGTFTWPSRENREMSSTEILMLIAKTAGAYILDDIGTGEIVLKEGDGTDMKLADADGRVLSARFPYALIEGLIQQSYVTQDRNDGRIYRISRDGLRAAQS
jgi:hypothetical protein